jgi:hypothetical protein
MTSSCTTPLGRLFLERIPAFSTPPDGNVPSSQLTEHRGIASADIRMLLYQGFVKAQFSFIHYIVLLGLQERGASILYVKIQ